MIKWIYDHVCRSGQTTLKQMFQLRNVTTEESRGKLAALIYCDRSEAKQWWRLAVSRAMKIVEIAPKQGV
jgi:hypothetical protein